MCVAQIPSWESTRIPGKQSLRRKSEMLRELGTFDAGGAHSFKERKQTKYQ